MLESFYILYHLFYVGNKQIKWTAVYSFLKL
uniref:Uncharacterized protein n=1 Tax=Anguilla anguilla TaxID=7936 RepID=A0A0E9TAY7_ANGAN